MNAALIIEEPVETIRIMPAPQSELRLEIDFSIDNFEVPIGSKPIAGRRRSPDPDCSTPVSLNLILTSRLTATETLCVRKILKP